MYTRVLMFRFGLKTIDKSPVECIEGQKHARKQHTRSPIDPHGYLLRRHGCRRRRTLLRLLVLFNVYDVIVGGAFAADGDAVCTLRTYDG